MREAAAIGLIEKAGGRRVRFGRVPSALLAEAAAGGFVGAADLFVELGSPNLPSVNLLFTEEKFDADSLILLADPPAAGSYAFAQVVRVSRPKKKKKAEDEPVDDERIRLAAACLPLSGLAGCMVRRNGARVWMRLSRRPFELGLDWRSWGGLIREQVRREAGRGVKVEVALVCGRPELVEELAEMGRELADLREAEEKKSMKAQGNECTGDGDCETCEDRDVCDVIKDIGAKVRRYRREKMSAGGA